MLINEIIAVYSESHVKHNTPNAKLFIFKADVTYIYHYFKRINDVIILEAC
jgi:hypothetical protein